MIKPLIKKQGFGLSEYLVGLGAVVAIFTTPVLKDDKSKKYKSISHMLIDAVKQEHSAYIYTASLSNLPKLNQAKKQNKNGP